MILLADNLLWGEGIPGILGGSIPPGSPNDDPILDQKMSCFTPVFRPVLYEILLYVIIT